MRLQTFNEIIKNRFSCNEVFEEWAVRNLNAINEAYPVDCGDGDKQVCLIVPDEPQEKTEGGLYVPETANTKPYSLVEYVIKGEWDEGDEHDWWNLSLVVLMKGAVIHIDDTFGMYNVSDALLESECIAVQDKDYE